jgi:hypothetical protein
MHTEAKFKVPDLGIKSTLARGLVRLYGKCVGADSGVDIR